MRLRQQNRLLQVFMPDYDDIFILTHISGVEGLSQNFHLDLTLLTKDEHIECQKLLGKVISISINQAEEPVIYNGVIWSIYPSGICQGLMQYQVQMVPWFECLSLSQDCRVFHQKSVLQIFTEVCQGLGFYDFDLSHLVKRYQALAYCVQYNESTLVFLQRILAQEGLFFYYAHSPEKHVLILVDEIMSLPSLEKLIGFRDSGTHGHMINWRPCKKLQATKFLCNAYSFKAPNANLLASVQGMRLNNSLINPSALEAYYFDNHVDQCGAEANVKNIRAIANWQANIIEANSNIAELRSGRLFTYEDQQYALITSDFKAHDLSDLVEEYTEHESIKDYKNSFSAIATDKGYYPLAIKVNANGYHQGVVVSKMDSELDTDIYAQVKVRMLWERHPAQALEMVQYARVSQAFLGKAWGAQFIPRFKQEVSVGHLNGDFSQPVVLSSLYNARNPPLFPLPQAQNKMGVKTHSLNNKDPATGNSLMMDDTANAQMLSLYAEKDLNMHIQNDYIHNIKADEKIEVDGDQLMQLLNGSAHLTAKEIHLIVGETRLVLDDNGIKALGGTIKLLAKGVGELLPVARCGDKHTCPKIVDATPHQGGPILEGAANITANYQAIARVGDRAHCHNSTDIITTGVASITVNGKPLARLNDKTEHGGVIIKASPDVLAGESS